MDSNKTVTAAFSCTSCDTNTNESLEDDQPNLVTVAINNGEENITIVSPVGTTLIGLRVVDESQFDSLPANTDFPHGIFEFELEGVDIGDTAEVTIYLPDGASPTTYYKYGPEPTNQTDHWYEFIYNDQTETGAIIDGNVITLYLADGKWGDDDLTANGIIVDDGGPGLTKEEENTSGCFINTSVSSLYPFINQ